MIEQKQCGDRSEFRRGSCNSWKLIDRDLFIVLQEVTRRGEQVQGLGVGLAELILIGGWFLWWERRQLVHGENLQRPLRSGLSIATLTKNYKLAAKKRTELRPRLAETSERISDVEC